MEKSFIGEEVIEPDEQPIRNDDLIDEYGGDRNNEEFFNEFDDNYGQPIDRRGSMNLDLTNTKDSSYLN